MLIACFLQNFVKFEISAKFINLFFLLDLKTGMGSELVKVYKSTFHMMACLYFSLKIGQNLALTLSQKAKYKVNILALIHNFTIFCKMHTINIFN